MNPFCFEYLIQNIKLNNVQDKIISFNECARIIFNKIINKTNPLNLPEKYRKIDHFYMNLPGSATEFLDIFEGIFLNEDFDKKIWDLNSLPLIHVYTFLEIDEEIGIKKCLLNKIKETCKKFEEKDIEDIQIVKDVSSKKKMFCISLRLSLKVAKSEIINVSKKYEPEVEKKVKTNVE